jgi:DNA-binding CsgD family transcriptional regulator
MLYEREDALRELDAAQTGALAGGGRIVLIGGEAGIGKTALVEAFTRWRPNTVRLLWGACDLLFTPRPLGPLHDMAGQLPPDAALPAALAAPEAGHAPIFAAALRELAARPTLAVFEDIHWADEATLDLLRFLGRRVGQTRALLLLTYRDDELGPRHPLRLLLGDLAAVPHAGRLRLEPLSADTVRELAGERGVDAAMLHRRTGGNPFFVAEALAAMGELPPTVRDAVLARAARLSPAARAVLDAAAVLGTRLDLSNLLAVARPNGGDVGWPALEECLAGGMLLAQGEQIAFRHDLAREAILEAISPPQRLALHRRALASLAGPEGAELDKLPLNRLVHHARAAADRAAVLRYAPAAARRAAAAGAHNDAANLYRLALDAAGDLPPAELAPLLEAFAKECNLVDRREEGAEVCRRAAAIWRALGNPVREGAVLADLANMVLGVGQNEAARRHADEAVALLQKEPPGKELAFALMMRASLHMLDHEYAACIAVAERSIAVAEAVGEHNTVLSARAMLGTGQMYLDFAAGRRTMEENQAAARAAGRPVTVAHVYANLGSVASELYHLRLAERVLTEGLAYADEHDLSRLWFYMLGWRAMTLQRLGRWAEAERAATDLLARPGVSVPSRITALSALGQLRARAGRPDVWLALDEAAELARPVGSLHRVALVAAVRAEAAALAADRARAAAEAAVAYDAAAAVRHPWFTGELGIWLAYGHGGEVPAMLPEWVAEPYRLQAAGDWRGAAAAWERLECPYETARALAGGDDAAQREALGRFEALGARPAADELRARLRAAGATHLPRGPRPATRDNPFGLTPRQADVLALLAEGLTNAQIAARLQLSPKTVDHHVSAVLAKLDVPNREAAKASYELRMTND